MNTPETIEPTRPAPIRSSDGLESVKRYNQHTYWEDEGMTIIGDYECNKIVRFQRVLSDEEVRMWCSGYETGRHLGIDEGRRRKEQEIRHALGL